jgi:3-phosphoshikimate 1-carboxyvinyltransferase
MLIDGGQLTTGRVDSHGDHRIAMAFAMAALRAQGEIEISDCDNVSTSFPGFVDLAAQAGLHIKAD